MKRTPLKRKTGLSRRPKSDKAKAKAETWRLMSLYIRYRDALKTTGTLTSCACVTCGRIKPTRAIGGIQCGHFLPGRHNAIIYDRRNMAGQCSFCNDHLKGNWPAYYDYMLREYGQAVIDELKARDREVVSWSIDELEILQAQLRADITAMGGELK